MKKYFGIIKSVSLFKDINVDNLESVVHCLSAEVKSVRKEEIILLAGDKPEYVGVVLNGRINVVREDIDGNRTIIATVSQGDTFAEALCCAMVKESPATIVADTDAEIMLMKFDRILHVCPKTCNFHQKIVENMLKQIARKNLMMQDRMEIISTKSIRSRVLKFLESYIPKQGKTVTIPFNREEMAEFLCVERSALSHELSRMKEEGILDYKKNVFKLHT